MARTLTRFALSLLLAAGPCLAASAEPEFAAVGPFRLPGDLEVVTLEHHADHAVTIDTWIAAGSVADFAGYPGLAAATAIALWEGGKPSLAARIEELGGTSRLTVVRDAVHFSATVPAGKVSETLAAIGERFAHPDWAATDLERVRRQLAVRRAAMPAVAIADQRLLSELYGPDYGHPVYGRDETGAPLALADIQAFYARHYVPAHTKVVLVGDLDTGKSVGQVVNGYAGYLKREAEAAAPPARPLAAAPLAWGRDETRLVAGARGPALAEQREQAAMDLIAAVLAGEGQGRITEALGETARDVSARWLAFKGPGALVVQVRTEAKDTMAVEKAVRDALGELRTKPVTLNEHAKASREVLSAYDRENHTDAQQAATLGYYALVGGDFRLAKTYPDVVRQISRQDMMEAAQKYLTPDSVKVVVVGP